MGFDVLYFPPIHPIGTTNRKGRNNALKPAPGRSRQPLCHRRPRRRPRCDPCRARHAGGFPPAGGRRRASTASRSRSISPSSARPTIPGCTQHPEWFRRRADGSIRYAENPPKKYEDIVNVDFYAEGAMPELWLALRDVVLHWVGEGVRIFRVDNPHTKPLPFWEWMIADVRGRHPDVMFLAEAFTRPKMMYRLAKIGFSQSYTYFTWRNTKSELTDYLRELTTTEVADYYRPNFFVNTPDINPVFPAELGPRRLPDPRRAGGDPVGPVGRLFRLRALRGRGACPGARSISIRRSTRSGIATSMRPATSWPRSPPSTACAALHPALHSHLGVRFYNAFNDQVLVYGKAVARWRER